MYGISAYIIRYFFQHLAGFIIRRKNLDDQVRLNENRCLLIGKSLYTDVWNAISRLITDTYASLSKRSKPPLLLARTQKPIYQ